ncbi:MAG: cytochrome d ubiquinol oxidase subunit II [Deltaproteobacteria bacterium]|nr:cytochrome d ubiquinol oxidase subunit II [Deltaproteobacteria bacterium]
MDILNANLGNLWFFLVGLFLALALVMDGFDLGVGIISLFTPEEAAKKTLMASVAPVWHANLTWLVVAGGMLFGAFPGVYSLALSALYLPVALLLFGLMARGVGLEFHESVVHQPVTALAFGLGSLLTALALGFVLGGWLNGLSPAAFASVGWRWLSPLGLAIAGAVVLLCVFLGACHLVDKAEGPLALANRRWALLSLLAAVLAALGLFLWLRGRYPFLTANWLAWPGFLYSLLPLLLGLVFLGVTARQLARPEAGGLGLWSRLGGLFLSLGLAGSMFPYVAPPDLTVAATASPIITLQVMLVGVAIFLPVMAAYNLFLYRVFRGKAGGGYAEH